MRSGCSVLCFLVAAFVHAPGSVTLAGDAGRPAHIALGFGVYDVLNHEDRTSDLRVEYRSHRRLWSFGPWFGLEVTGDRALFGLGGLLFDLNLGPRWVLTLSGGVGVYGDGDGKDLGHTIELRSQIEMGYRFARCARLGLAFSHTSNAGLGDINPGAEVATIYYAIPLERRSGPSDGSRGRRSCRPGP